MGCVNLSDPDRAKDSKCGTFLNQGISGVKNRHHGIKGGKTGGKHHMKIER